MERTCTICNRGNLPQGVFSGDKFLCSICIMDSYQILQNGTTKALSLSSVYDKWLSSCKSYKELQSQFDQTRMEHREEVIALQSLVNDSQTIFAKVKKAREELKRAERRKNLLDRIALKLAKEITTVLYPCGGEMPDVPSPYFVIDDLTLLPEDSGVYFIWEHGVVTYVGQSVNLSQRVTTTHEHIQHGNQASWLLFPKNDLTAPESYYIWRCRPKLNFGGRLVPRY